MEIHTLIPQPHCWEIPWETLESVFAEFVRPMALTEQNPVFHGEGDVWTHTKLVCTALAGLPAFRALEETRRQEVFLAAVLHDVGKISTTRWEDGNWVSPHHSSAGEKLARRFLWQELDVSGTAQKQAFRETVCSLIRYHTLPTHAIDDPDGARKLRTAAERGRHCPDFSVELLCLLSQADVMGRSCRDQQTLLEQISLCRALAEESGCRHHPFPFASDHTRHAYLSGRNVLPELPLYDDTWGEVILLSGLPGTGKDTWIQANCPELPVVSLDAIRAEWKYSPTDNQTPVVEAAREKAREYLRKKQSFVWNATNTTAMVRRKQLQLFEAYGASVRIVWLETGWEEQLRRNRSRKAEVPEPVICHLLEALEPPQPEEAKIVDWICTG